MSLRCWFGRHDPYHPRASADGQLVATCRRCDRDVALDLTTDVGRPRVTQASQPDRLRLARPPLRLVKRKAR